MSSDTFFSGVFGGTGGREGGFSMIYLIFFHYLGNSGVLDTFPNYSFLFGTRYNTQVTGQTKGVFLSLFANAGV